MVYMGTSVVYGRGEGVVVATGMGTEMGKIAGLLAAAEKNETPLQRRMAKLSRTLSLAVLAICVVVFAVQVIRSYLATGHLGFDNVMPAFMLAISLAVAAIPEGLAAVVTIVLSLGVTKMAKRNAIVRNLTSVETLGSAQVIASDKTGTITQNKMTVVDSYGADPAELALGMALASDSQLAPDGKVVGDPTENALVTFALEQGLNKNEIDAKYPRIGEAPFDSDRKMMSTLHNFADAAGNSTVMQFTKGAPDEVLRNCTAILVNGQKRAMTDADRSAINQANAGFADRALRVLALAERTWPSAPDRANLTPSNLERDLTFVGLVAEEDPVRPEVADAVRKAAQSGIRVVMITGDSAPTAGAIAKQIGIIQESGQVLTGRELDEISDEEFLNRVHDYNVYARVQPEHKVRIVKALQSNGLISSMTGDGVNDSPSLKAADIGVGMGITGTDVSKGASDIVLSDDNFASIVTAVEEGRRIYDNIRKTIQFLLSTNLAEVIAIFVATLMGFTLFRPVHLLFINLVTDSLPAIALGMEDTEPGIMERKPRSSGESLFAGGLGIDLVWQGILIACLTLASYFIVDWGWFGGVADPTHSTAMTAAFLTLVACECGQALAMRSRDASIFRLRSRNITMWWAVGLSAILSVSIMYIPVMARAFSLEPLSMRQFAIAAILGLAIFPIIEIYKEIKMRATGTTDKFDTFFGRNPEPVRR
jgi:Ca2+-transporting ATPase